MSKIKLFILGAGIICMRIIYFVLKLLPTQKKYLFLSKVSNKPPCDFEILADALEKAHPDYKIVMLCSSMENKPKYIFHMLRQMYHLATCEVVFLDRSNMVIHVLNHKAQLKVIQLWHALGSMKKFGYAILDTEEGQPSEIARVMKMHRGYSLVLISSLSFIDDFVEGFDIDASRIVEIPLPRVDLLLDEGYQEKKKRQIVQEFPQLLDKRTIMYCPTFRKNESPEVNIRIQELVDNVDFESYNFVYCPHSLSKVNIEDSRVLRTTYSSQEMLSVADIVISDYSSIVYEAGLLNIPVYLYAYDWDDYQKSRSHNLDLNKDIPVIFSDSARTIFEAIEANRFDQVLFKEFIEMNVRVPSNGTCCDSILSLIDEL